MGDNQPTKRRNRGQITKDNDEEDAPTVKPKQAKKTAAQTHPKAEAKQTEAAKTPPKHSSSRVASSKETLARLVPPNHELVLNKLVKTKEERPKTQPWYEDAL